MNWLALSGIVAGILSALCYVPYVRDIVKGTTKPERASWFIWTTLTVILLLAQLAKGATNSIWLTVVQSLGVVLIFVLSLKYGEGGFARRDVIALSLAGAGLIAWYFTKNASIALWLTIGIDFAGAYLTVVKAYREPRSETPETWFLSGLAGVFGAFAVGSWSIDLLAFPIYVVIINTAVFSAIYLGFAREKKKHKTA